MIVNCLAQSWHKEGFHEQQWLFLLLIENEQKLWVGNTQWVVIKRKTNKQANKDKINPL